MSLEEDYYKPVTVVKFWNNIHNEYESNGNKNKPLSIKEYLNEIKSYLKDMNNLQKSDAWTVQLKVAINFISSKDIDEERVMHSKSNNIEIISHDKADELIAELLHPIF